MTPAEATAADLAVKNFDKGSPEDITPPNDSPSAAETPAPSMPAAQQSAVPDVKGPNEVAKTAIDPMHPSAEMLTPAEAKERDGEETMTMMFPHRVLLTVSHTRQIEFQQGPQEVPKSLVTHPYIIANGVKPFHPGSAPPTTSAEALEAQRQSIIAAQQKLEADRAAFEAEKAAAAKK